MAEEQSTEEGPKRRSARINNVPARALLAQETAPDTAQPPPAPADQSKKGARKQRRKASSLEPQEEGTDDEVVSTKKQVKLRYYCPISSCPKSKSRASDLKEHYNTEHKDVLGKETWDSKLARTQLYSEWKAENERLKASVKEYGKAKERGKAKKAKLVKQDEKALREVRRTPEEEQLRHAASTADGFAPAFARDEGESPTQSRAPTSVTPVATAAVTIDEEGSSAPPPRKRRKLDALLDTHKIRLQSFVEHELKEETDRADKAESKLQRLSTEREAELARSTEREQKMGEKIGKLEREIQDEKKWGSSTALKAQYLEQARFEARIAARSNTLGPQHGGFVY